jgi:hypothetical protein
MKRYFGLAVVVMILKLVATFVATVDQTARPLSLRAVAAAPSAVEIGVPMTGENALEIVGRVNQDGVNLDAYGYLSHIHGITDSLLFLPGTPPLNRNESNARFAYKSNTTLTSRYVISNVFVIDSAGPFVIYFNSSPYGNFENPSSFDDGTPIYMAAIRAHDVLNVQAPNLGIANGVAELRQGTATEFTLSGQPYRLERADLRERLVFTGQGIRTDAVTPKSITVGAGYVLVTAVSGQEGYLLLIKRDSD